MVILAVILIFLVAFLLAMVMFSLDAGPMQAPMRRLRQRFAARSDLETHVRVLRDDRVSSLPSIQRILGQMPVMHRFSRYLAQADLQPYAGTVIGATLLLAFLGGWITGRWTTAWYWPLLGGGFCGSLPLLYIRRRRRQRLSLYVEQLPDVLDVLSRSLQAGQSFMQGIQTVAREMSEPAATEYQMTFEELRLGSSLRQALQTHANRVESFDFNLVSTAILIQRDVGGNLTEILNNASHTIRERYKLLRHVQALAAQNKLGSQVVGTLPFIIAGIIYLVNPSFIMILFQDELGQKLVMAAIAMQLLGYYCLKRIIAIKI